MKSSQQKLFVATDFYKNAKNQVCIPDFHFQKFVKPCYLSAKF